MNDDVKPCQSYLPENGTYGPCRDGFPQTAPCSGFSSDDAVPICCNEALCARLFDQFGGKPPEHMLSPRPPVSEAE